jgi:hypothetical protein
VPEVVPLAVVPPSSPHALTSATHPTIVAALEFIGES